MDILTRFAKWIGLAVLFLIVWMASCVAMVSVLEVVHLRAGRRDVTRGNPHYMFPVLVLPSRQGGKPLVMTGVNSAKAYVPAHTFLIPKDKLGEVNRQMASTDSNCKVDILWERDGRQYLKVNGPLGEEYVSNTSWYVADAKGIAPKYELIFRGRLLAFEAVPLGTIVAVTAWAVGGALYCRHMRRKQRTNG